MIIYNVIKIKLQLADFSESIACFLGDSTFFGKSQYVIDKNKYIYLYMHYTKVCMKKTVTLSAITQTQSEQKIYNDLNV